MIKLVALELYPDNSTLYAYDALLDFNFLDHASEHRLEQGFSGHPRSQKFFTIGECMSLRVEIWNAEEGYSQSAEVALREDTVRAVIVPFSISPSRSRAGIMITNMMRDLELLVRQDAGEYALVFEIKLRNDPEYLNSSEYQEDVSGGFTQECCYLTFYRARKSESVEPKVLRTDAWTSPPYLFGHYTPLAPAYPLVLDAEPTCPQT
ncbi:hypothetical protein [Scytonema sp. PRP1]|uniref:hypothetical protein n=1 Tax=Scytonema sp. PRP1 TaxID=3120513 RepID=UPI00300CD983